MNARPISSLLRLAPLLLLIVPLALTAPARGQGTGDALPDPISSRDLDVYGRLLGLGDQQRLAVDQLHAEYLERFASLRDGDIEEFMDRSQRILSSFMWNPDVEGLRKALRDHEQLLSRIERMDRSLFDALAGVLTEEQAAQLARVALRRERQRTDAGLVRMIARSNPGARADIAGMADAIDLDDADRLAIDPMLEQWEIRSAAATRRLAQEARTTFIDLAERMETLLADEGGTVEDLQAGRVDPERMRRLFGSFREIWSETSARTREAASELATMNWRSARGMLPMLSDDGAEALAGRYLESIYRETWPGMAGTVDAFRAVMRRSDLAGRERDELGALRGAFRDRHLAVAEEMIRTIDATRAEADFGGFRRRGGDDALAPLRERQKALEEEAKAAIASILGADSWEAIAADEGAAERGAGGGEGGGRRDRGRARDRAPRGAYGLGSESTVDAFLPGPITERELRHYVARLGLDADERAVAEALHQDYLDRYAELERERLDPIAEARRGLWSWDPETFRVTAPEPGVIDRIWTMRSAALVEVDALDAAFFDDLALATIFDDASARAAAMRGVRDLRVRIGRDVGAGRGPGRPRGLWSVEDAEEARLDLSVVLREQGLPPAELAAIAPLLATYERELTAAVRHRYDEVVALMREVERGDAERATAGGGRGWGGMNDEHRRRWSAARDAVVALNRDAVERFAASLDELAAEAVRTAYRRTAWPEIFGATPAERALTAALALETLTPAERDGIVELMAEFRPRSLALCERELVLEQERLEESSEEGPDRWQARRERANRAERIRFERTELEERVLRRIEAILGEARTAALRVG